MCMDKEQKAIARLKEAALMSETYYQKPLVVTTSGGKDSDVVIDPCAGSGTTLRAAQELGRSSYGFEVSKSFYRDAVEKMLTPNRDENQIGFEEIMAV